MSWIGDYVEDYATLNFKFPTRNVQSPGSPPATLAGSPVVSVYKADDTTQSTVGVALTVDFDGLTGLNNVLIDLSADAFYATGQDYMAVITAGTVNSISVVGSVVAEFSIENRNAGRLDLDVVVGTLVAANFAANFIDATKVAADTIGASQLAADGIAEIRDAFLDRVLSGNHDAADTPGALLQIIGDAIAELPQAAPSATPTPVAALMLLYMALRDKLNISDDSKEIHNDAGTLIAKKATTDDGSVYSEAKMVSGP